MLWKNDHRIVFYMVVSSCNLWMPLHLKKPFASCLNCVWHSVGFVPFLPSNWLDKEYKNLYLNMLIAAHVLGRLGVRLYEPIWFIIPDKQSYFARIYHSRSLVPHPSCNRTLVYVSGLSPILILQCQIVSFFLAISPIIFALKHSYKPGLGQAENCHMK